MDVSSRAARDQLAMERLIAAADALGERFDVPFDPDTVRRHDPDSAVKALFIREGVADFLDALVLATTPAEKDSKPEKADKEPVKDAKPAGGRRG